MSSRATIPPVQAGFSDPVFQSQFVFRTVLDAIARPARPVRLDVAVMPPEPLHKTTAALLLALADFETSVWFDPAISPAAIRFIGFHTGARVVSDPAAAHFAVIAGDGKALPWETFCQGTPDYPDTSTTLLIQVASLTAAGQAFEGPGVDGQVCFSTQPEIARSDDLLAANRKAFPCGLDMFFLSAHEIAALPRSIRLVAG